MMYRIPNILAGFVAAVSKNNVFSNDLAVEHRKDDNILEYLDTIFRTISNTVSNIRYIGHELIDERKEYPSGYVQIYDSYTYCVRFHFEIEGEVYDNSRFVTQKKRTFVVLKIPKLINNYYYYINGVKFYPIYQFTDATIFHKKDKTTSEHQVVLKTLLTPITLSRSNTVLTDINGITYPSHIFKLNMFKHKINLMHLFYCKFGFIKTLKFFEGQKSLIALVSPDNIDHYSDKYIFFKINKNIYLRADKSYAQYPIFLNIVSTIIDSFKKKITVEEILDQKYWQTNMVSIFTKSSKGSHEAILKSFERLYDTITRNNIILYEDYDRKDIYEVIRWMVINFNKLIFRDNNDIRYKRVRMSEFMIMPIIQKLNAKLFRLMANKDKHDLLKKYEDILTLPYSFNPDAKKNSKEKIIRPSDILLKSIINGNNTKYADCVNDLDLFNVGLRWTMTTPSTSSGKKKSNELALSQREHSPTFLGIISINTASASDPGGTGVFTPFARVKDGKFIIK